MGWEFFVPARTLIAVKLLKRMTADGKKFTCQNKPLIIRYPHCLVIHIIIYLAQRILVISDETQSQSLLLK